MTIIRNSSKADTAQARASSQCVGEGSLIAVAHLHAPARALVDAARRLLQRLRRAVRSSRRGGDKTRGERESYLSRAGDAADLERRERTWDRSEAGAFSLADWT